MGCSRRVKKEDLRAEQKWDFISLNDFKSTSCLTPFAYAYLWMSLLISTAVYGVDTFTAVNLLVFRRWSGEIKPYIPISISRWIFSGCIIASFINLGFEHVRAYRTMRRGAVAESYLDNLAVRLECIRMGKAGRGWRRFLVFAELTKSRKGTEYVALFTYFSFQAWFRVIFCQGPRQVINALTLYSVFKLKLIPSDMSDVSGTLLSFFKNIEILAEEDYQQAMILSGMVFTLVIWIFSALSLILAVLFYLLFLWHYIPNHDGGLAGFCERKVNSRLAKIVSAKVNKAIEEEELKRRKEEAKAAKKGEKIEGRQATVPVLLLDGKDDKLPDMPMLYRNDTVATLPQYQSRPGTPSGNVPQLPSFELSQMDQNRPMTGRTVTGSSFRSNAPLMQNAGEMGFGRVVSPGLPPLDINTSGFPNRTNTVTSQNSQWRGPTPGPMMGSDRGFTASPLSYADDRGAPFGGLQRQNSLDAYGRPIHRAVGELRSFTPAAPAPSMGPRNLSDPRMQGNGLMSPGPRSEYDPFNPNQGRSSPGPGSEYGRQMPWESNQGRSSPGPGSEYGRQTPYNPNQGRSSPAPRSDYGRQSPFNPALQVNALPSPALVSPVSSIGGNRSFNPTQQPVSPRRVATGGLQTQGSYSPIENPPRSATAMGGFNTSRPQQNGQERKDEEWGY